jgi:hypothetical protein
MRLVEGERTVEERTEAYWYFARLENAKRWNPVEGVSIFITSVEQADASGTFTVRWEGEMPLRWRHQRDLLPKKIGPPAECDICCVIKVGPIEAKPVVVFQTHFETEGLQTTFSGPFRMRMTLQGKGIEADTTPRRVEISWDGQWADETKQMAHHFVIKEV